MTVHRQVEVTARNHIGGKNFAFFTHPRSNAHIYVHSHDLRDAGFDTHVLRRGLTAVIDYEILPDGRFRTVSIHSLGGAKATGPLRRRQERKKDRPVGPLPINHGKQAVGKIKVYYPNKGFGFLVYEDYDLFFHIEMASAQIDPEELLPDRSFKFVLGRNHKGPTAVLVGPAE